MVMLSCLSVPQYRIVYLWFCNFQFTQFLSDSGGVLGLWLGMSLLTVFEMFEFVLDIAILGVADIYVSAVQSRRRRHGRVNPSNFFHPDSDQSHREVSVVSDEDLQSAP